jgi:hypothetical protein
MSNPYSNETAEWHLHNLLESAEANHRTFSEDATRYMKKAEEALRKIESLKSSIEILVSAKENKE